MYLQNKGYPYEEKDVNKDTSARNDMISRGIRGVPAFIIGANQVVGLDTGKIEALMEKKLINCPNCESKLRIPRGKGKLKITCPKCKHEFNAES